MGGLFFGISYLFRRIGKTSPFDRRELIVGGLLTLLGGSMGTGRSLEHQIKLNQLEENARYLDEQYQLVYHNI